MTVMGERTDLKGRNRRRTRTVRRARVDADSVIDLRDEAMHYSLRPRRERRLGSTLLRLALIAFDALAIFVAWVLALVLLASVSSDSRSTVASTAFAAGIALAGVLLLRSQGLYLARVSSVRTDEMSRLVRSSVLITLGAAVAANLFDIEFALQEAIVGGILMLVLLFVGRGIFRAWINTQRANGRFCRPIVIVGANNDARDMVEIVRTHPETGLVVTAVFGDQTEADDYGLGALYGGAVEEAVLAVDAAEITGAVVAVSALEQATLNRVVRELVATGTHVHLTSGLQGIAHRRLRSQSIAHEPMLYLEPIRLAWWQDAMKRLLDICGAGLVLIPTAPLIGLFALIVRLQDGGPAFFRQARVGRNGEIFEVLKIRTMSVDAEQRLEDLQAENERAGPLFKVEDDPRFTKVGRFLDITSLNELPQLWNVMRGEMSMVGPRPALPSEAKEFDEELHARFMVRPGITGLWQVEARDNPSFAAYRRLDLHYVENWSVTFDFVILLSTVEVVVSRLVQGLMGKRRKPLTDETETKLAA